MAFTVCVYYVGKLCSMVSMIYTKSVQPPYDVATIIDPAFQKWGNLSTKK